MNKNERINAKTALRKTQIRQHGGTGRGNFVPDSKAGTGLKKAIIILPILIIIILVITLIVVINQLNQMFDDVRSEKDTDLPRETTVLLDESKLLMVVSPESPLPSGYKTDLTEVGSVQADKGIVPDLEQLMEDADNSGLSLLLTGGYVSAEQQHDLFNDEVSRLMKEESLTQTNAIEKAEKTVPAENHSERQSGLAVTFGQSSGGDFSVTKEYDWLVKNAMKYGFILRYPEGKEKSTGFSFDPTLFRYVGKENALKIKTLSMTLEEYVSYLKARQ